LWLILINIMTNAYWINEKYYAYLCTIRNSRCAYYTFFFSVEFWNFKFESLKIFKNLSLLCSVFLRRSKRPNCLAISSWNLWFFEIWKCEENLGILGIFRIFVNILLFLWSYVPETPKIQIFLNKVPLITSSLTMMA
jgi:hypothetical protein